VAGKVTRVPVVVVTNTRDTVDVVTSAFARVSPDARIARLHADQTAEERTATLAAFRRLKNFNEPDVEEEEPDDGGQEFLKKEQDQNVPQRHRRFRTRRLGHRRRVSSLRG
jgi:hypothetical protein